MGPLPPPHYLSSYLTEDNSKEEFGIQEDFNTGEEEIMSRRS
jgi:hypothetical protein